MSHHSAAMPPVLVPPLSLQQLPVSVVTAYWWGNWHCFSPEINFQEKPTNETFSAFSMLTLLLASDGQPLIPVAGVSFSDCMKMLDTLFWLLHLGMSHSFDGDFDPENVISMINCTPLLECFQNLLSDLWQWCADGICILEQCWELHPPQSQVACTYEVLSHVDHLHWGHPLCLWVCSTLIPELPIPIWIIICESASSISPHTLCVCSLPSHYTTMASAWTTLPFAYSGTLMPSNFTYMTVIAQLVSSQAEPLLAPMLTFSNIDN